MSGCADKEKRIAAFFALSECFREPTPQFVADVRTGALQRVLEGVCEVDVGGLTLEPAGSLDDVTEALTDEYYALFKGPFPPYVVAVESAYKAWAESSPAAECGKERDMLMGDPAIEMLKRYRSDGIELPPAYKAYPDHIALILEYAGLLLERGAPGAYRKFVATHLDWIEALRRDIHSLTESPFYRTAADLLCAFAREELELAGAPSGGIERPATICSAR